MSGIRPFDESGGMGGRDPTADGVTEIPGGGFASAGLASVAWHGFPDAGWDPAAYALAVLAEWAATGAPARLALPAPPDPLSEVASLLGSVGGRDRSLPEILAQHADPMRYWADLLTLPRAALPATFLALTCAATVARVAAMHLKAQIKRPRPAQILPGLMPPVLTPQTPSYPGAHASEAYLIVEVIGHVAPALAQVAGMLADRMAMLRETAGLNFPSDRTAAKTLAVALYPTLAASPRFAAVVAAAQKEWAAAPAGPKPAAS